MTHLPLVSLIYLILANQLLRPRELDSQPKITALSLCVRQL